MQMSNAVDTMLKDADYAVSTIHAKVADAMESTRREVIETALKGLRAPAKAVI